MVDHRIIRNCIDNLTFDFIHVIQSNAVVQGYGPISNDRLEIRCVVIQRYRHTLSWYRFRRIALHSNWAQFLSPGNIHFLIGKLSAATSDHEAQSHHREQELSLHFFIPQNATRNPSAGKMMPPYASRLE